MKKIKYDNKNRCYKVELTQGKFALIDKDDLGRVIKFNWHYNKPHNGYEVSPQNGSNIPLNRFVMELTDKQKMVIHHNGNKLDCRKSNLQVIERQKLFAKAISESVKNDKTIKYNSKLKCYEFELSRGKFALIDSCDIDKVKQYNWCWALQGINGKQKPSVFRSVYHGKKENCDKGYFNLKREYLSRFIFDLQEGDTRRVIFSNEDRFDFRRSNLKLLTMQEFNKMTALHHVKRTTTQYVPVTTRKDSGKYNYVHRRKDGKFYVVISQSKADKRFTGSFANEKIAALVVDAYLLNTGYKLHRRNFPFYDMPKEEISSLLTLASTSKLKRKFEDVIYAKLADKI